MKKIILAFTLTALSVLIYSCDRDQITTQTQDCCGGFRGWHFFTGIQKAEELIIKPTTNNPYEHRKYDYTSLLVMVLGKGYSQFGSTNYEEFKRLATEIGDTPKEEKYRFATPAEHETLSSGVSAISLKALTDYNESHPQGSSLKDIIRISFSSFDHNFNSELKPKEFPRLSNAGLYLIEPNENFTPIKYPALHMKSYPKEKDQEGGVVMSIEFTEAPSTPTQRFEVILSFANGQELKQEITADIVKLEN